MQVDAFAWCNAFPAGGSLGATQDQQQLVMPVLPSIPVAAILRSMPPPVGCHPYL